MYFILLIVGFLILIEGSNIFVEGSSAIAKKFHIPSIIIGLTIVSISTSLPELSVSVTSSLANLNDLSISNAIGSNIFNVLMILGVSSLITKLPIEKNSIKFDLPFLISSSLLLLVMLFDLTISRIEGFMFLIVFILFLYDTIKPVLKNKDKEEDSENTDKSMFKIIMLIIIGIGLVYFGGQLVIKSVNVIAETFGISQTLIGITITSLCTSCPEFITSVMAVKKGENGICLGNVIGSNIFNIVFILGVASVISPINVSFIAIIDVILMIIAFVLLYIFVFRTKTFNKWQGVIFIILYVSYIIYTIVR